MNVVVKSRSGADLDDFDVGKGILQGVGLVAMAFCPLLGMRAAGWLAGGAAGGQGNAAALRGRDTRDGSREGHMDLKEYFGSRHGIGVLASADAEGRVDAAIYARPHVFDDGSVAFVMRERLTHRNIGENPHAAYLFIEDGARLGGIRLFLRRLREETDHPLIAAMTRPSLTPEEDRAKGPKHLVTFAVEKVLPLVGAG